MEHQNWNGFASGVWQDEINVRDFIQQNYKPYRDDAKFLAGPTERTKSLMKKVEALFFLERQYGGVLDIDTATVSSLIGYSAGYIDKDNEIYRNTRNFILSLSNPWYFEGSVAKGVGSPHTGHNKIWHIALTMQALTSGDETEIAKCLDMITNSHAGTFLMHESFDKDDDTVFTRP